MAPETNGGIGTDFILRVSSLFTPGEKVHNASVLCNDGRIDAVGGFSALRMLEDTPWIDLQGYHALPGLVDTHLHGTGGVACMDAPDLESLEPISRVLARHGVTSFLLTMVSAERDAMLSVIEAMRRLMARQHPGATPVGLHLEGPYLSTEKAGAQVSKYIRPIDLGEAREFFDVGAGLIRMMTFAPELAHSPELVALMCERDIVPSMGHSLADQVGVTAAIEAGACRCTHLFNGTTPLDQREAGLTAMALVDDRITVELIADGIHVHPCMIDLACRVKSLDRIVGISDAMQGAGLREGMYHLGDQQIEVRNGRSFRQSDGKLAGSCLTLEAAMRNLASFSSLSEADVISCFTRNAARSIGLDDRGEIRPGKRADIVVVDDDWNVRLTIVGGRVAYDSKGELGPGPESLPQGAL